MKLVIFDLDGTLLNTLQDLTDAANAALKACGFALRSKQEIQQFIGDGVTKLLERTLPDGQKNSENTARLKQAFFAYYDMHLWTNTFPYPGIEKLLQDLSARKVKLAVASNKYQSATQRLIKHFFAQIPFTAVLGQQEGVPTKPDPQMVFHVLRLAGVEAAESLYVGDSAIDMQTAKNAGVHACGATWGFRPSNELAAFNPLRLAETPQDILDIFH